jgi:dTDP-4-dehydrorhamnose reductase
MKVLLTGANGQLGRELVRQGRAAQYDIQSFDHQQLDITNEKYLHQVLKRVSPTLVINAAAYTNVDKAENESDMVYAVNSNGPGYLAVIHVSTDYVFDGSKGRPYRENDPIAPLGVYGQSKAQGEAIIRSLWDKHIIVRTSWMYGVYRNNFVKTILKLGYEKTEIRIVADQFGSPTSASDLAEALLTIVKKIDAGETFEWGTYHYCGKGITTWYGLAQHIIQLAKSYATLQVMQVTPITTAEWPTPTKRPPYSVLDCSLLKKQFGIEIKPWQESLKRTIDRIFSENQKQQECS